jgi:putative DNA methylase
VNSVLKCKINKSYKNLNFSQDTPDNSDKCIKICLDEGERSKETNIINTKIPKRSLIENELPIKRISQLASKEGNSKRPVYEIHKWWARRLSVVVRSIIIGVLLPDDASEDIFWDRFYSKNKVDITVMDNFMGGGTSLVEAKKMGARTIGIDIDPLACFITRKELEKCDYNKLEKEYKEISKNVGDKIKEFYLTEVDGVKYSINNIFWVYDVKCDSCNQAFQTHPHYKIYKKNGAGQYVFCSVCGHVEKIENNIEDFHCSKCNHITNINKGTYYRGTCTCPHCNNKFKLTDKVNGAESLKMFALEYIKGNERIFKQVSDKDIELYNNIKKLSEEKLNHYFVPKAQIPIENRKDKRPVTHGYHMYKDLFNSRQLLSLAMLYNEIVKIKDNIIREWFLIAFSDSLASNNVLCNYAYGYRKLTPLFGIHAYTVPVRPVENNVWGTGSYGRGTFEKTVEKLIRSKKYCDKVYESDYTLDNKLLKRFTGEEISSKVTNHPSEFYNGNFDSLIINTSSEDLGVIRDKSVDLILTDPPYYDNLHYSELADFYYQWLKPDIDSNDTNPIINSLFVNDLEENYHQIYEQKLIRIFNECYIKLKDDGIMVFSYHHNKEAAWIAMGKAIYESNFEITNILPVRSEGTSGYHTSDNSIKWDSIIVLRKKTTGNDYEHNKDLVEYIEYWNEYINTQELDMKDCDKISFFRSLAIMAFNKNKNQETIDCYLNKLNEYLKNNNV